MKAKKCLQIITKCRNNRSGRGKLIRSVFTGVSVCTLTVGSMFIGFRSPGNSESNQVYAASGSENDTASVLSDGEDSYLPSGIAGVVSGVSEAPSAGMRVERIGTSCENVMVGQRVHTIRESTANMSICSSMENTVNNLDTAVMTMAQSAKLMSDSDYDTLLRIVEAEAGSEDVKGRVLVANVIMNRVKTEGFPDTVTEVVWDQSYGIAQFSPTYDGRISRVTVTDETKEAVKQALEGVDYSEGALFFVQKSAADKKNVTWFEEELKFLFKYGVHDFYTYPDETEEEESTETDAETGEGGAGEDEKTGTDEKPADNGTAEDENMKTDKEPGDNVVQMVRNDTEPVME